ncbi:MAG TPA: acyl-CoA dehydrogenase family protein [Actinomycetota bacterium]|nr:acyl-CoA dehydrogenase family protein [Actinomycetota bacterium]
MDFAFTEEQEMLRASARRLMEERYPIERVAKIADGTGFVRSEWADVAALGWTGISVPEKEGGAGLSFLEEMVVAEELGRALYPGPYLSSVVMATHLLRIGHDTNELRDVVAGERIATVAWAGEDGRFDTNPAPKVGWDGEYLSAVRLFVPDIGSADLIVIVGDVDGGLGMWTVDREADRTRWRALSTVDTTRGMGEVVFEGTPAHLVAYSDAYYPHPRGLLRHVEALRDRALAALAVEAVGVASRALELALEHARTRQQFGRPIGSFQAVSHSLAQAFLEVETARSLAYWAAWTVSEGEPEAGRAAAAAKARAAQAALTTCERAIQTHGGIGFTWEHPLHRFYKRALGIAAFMGWGGELRARVAADLLDER